MPWEALEFYLDYLAVGRLAVYIDSITVNMRQHLSYDRLTIAHDHFEPFKTGAFFAEKKAALARAELLNFERSASLDSRMLSEILVLLRERRVHEARMLFQRVSWSLIDQYHYMRFGSFAWFSRRFGFELGSRSFVMVSRLIGGA